MREQKASERGPAEYFGRLAASYGRGEYFARRRATVIAALGKEIKPGARLLDLGCGNGAYSSELLRALRPMMVLGADLSFEMLVAAAARNAQVRLLCCDASSPPFRTGTLDVVFCSHVLQFVTNLDRCLEAILGCLQPGGLLAVAALGGGLRELIADQRWSGLAHSFRRAAPRGEREPHDLHDLASRCEHSGFTQVNQLRLTFPVTGAELAELFRARWMPLVDASARALAEEMLGELEGRRAAEEISASETVLFGRKPLQSVARTFSTDGKSRV